MRPIELVFLVPLITAVGWFLVTNLLMGGLMDGDADADVDLEIEAGDADIEADADADVEAGAAGASWLGFLGFKKVPFILWLQILGTIWGGTGLALLLWFDSFLLRAGAAGAATAFGTGAICGLLARVMPRTESDLEEDRHLLGTTGTVVTSRVTETFGQAGFSSKLGYMTREVRVAEGTSPLSQGEAVIVMDEREGVLIVQKETDLLKA